MSALAIGLSSRKISTGMPGTPSKIYFVNPGYQEIDGQPCYASLAALPETVDMAVLGIANARLEAAVAKAEAPRPPERLRVQVVSSAAVAVVDCDLRDPTPQ